MLDRIAGAFGAVGVYWYRARELVREYPGLVLVLWFLSFVAGVWL